jgi:hypothetical protein
MKTAVEWFVEEMFKQGYFNDTPLTVKNIESFVKQAKEMEKTEKAKEYLKGFKDGKEYEIKMKQLTFKSE